MKLNEKKCKGIGKAKGFQGCGKMTMWRKYGLCSSCYADFILNTDTGRILLEKAQLKASKPRRELEEAEKEMKQSKKLPVVIQQTQIVFNRYIRLRDKGKSCISSGVPWRPDFDAGHLFSVKQYSSLRFDEMNCHAQSIGDNRFKEGNFEDYLLNVKHRIGEAAFNELQKRAEQSKRGVHKWDIDHVMEIKKLYQEKIKKLKL